MPSYLVLGECTLPSFQEVAFLLCLHAEIESKSEQVNALVSLLVRTSVLSDQGRPLISFNLNSLEALSGTATTWEFRLSTCAFVMNTNIQSITATKTV